MLRPCPACERHVRYSESECPFCGVELAPATPPRLPDVSRLSRSARVALGAALCATASACGGGQPEPVPVYGAPAPTEQPNTPAPPPEEAPPETAPPEEGAPAPEDPGAVKPLYGVPAPDR